MSKNTRQITKQKYDEEFPAINDAPENIASSLFNNPYEASEEPKEPPPED